MFEALRLFQNAPGRLKPGSMTSTVVIVDYGSGNLRSVERSFERAVREVGADMRVVQTDCPETIAAADRVVLPGVGAFGACMSGLAERDGVLDALKHAVLAKERPFLGICVGMQLLAECGEEFGSRDGLGWVSGVVRRIDPGPTLRVPHMGWNEISGVRPHPILNGIENETFYFAHSFHLMTDNDEQQLATADYGGAITAAVARDHIVGVQFHPEKSQRAGITLISNFLTWDPLSSRS